MPKFDDMEVLLAKAHAKQVHEFDFKHDITVAQRLIDTFATSESVVFDEDAWWQYDAGIWQDLDREVIAKRLHRWQTEHRMQIKGADDDPPKFYSLTPGAFQRVVNHTKTATARPDFFENAPRGVMLRGQFVRAERDKLKVEAAHPNHRARTSLSVPYRADWTMPDGALLSRYLRTTFDTEPERQRLQEVAGAALLGLGTRFKKAWFFVDGPNIDGNGGTGKSQILEMLRGLVPEGASSSVVPQHFSDDYHGAELHGKTLNVVFETPDGDIIREDGVKAIVHGDTITRRRIRQAPLTFAPRALHVFATNRLPEAPGATGAFWDRWEVLEFSNRFRGTDDVIPQLAERILADELDHLVHWAIEGARRLVSQGAYTTSRRAREAMERWKMTADPVNRFVHEWCAITNDDFGLPTSSEVYEWYVDWCDENGRMKCSKTKFGRRLQGVDGVKRIRSNGSRYNLERKDEDNPWTG